MTPPERPASAPAFEPLNDLERALLEAATDVGRRPAFYRALAASSLFAIGRVAPAEAGKPALDLQALRRDDRVFFPAFTSAPRILAFATRGAPHVAMPSARLFELAARARAGIALNPGSAVGRLFPADEVAALLEGRRPPGPAPRASHGEEVPDYRAPEHDPKRLVEALRAAFDKLPGVKFAYLAEVPADPASGRTRHLVVGIDADESSRPAALRDAAYVVRQLLPSPAFADLVAMGGTPASRALATHGRRFFSRG